MWSTAKVIRSALRAPRAHRTRRELARLCATDTERKWLWAALLATMDHELEGAEKSWVERIEGLRQDLRSSQAGVAHVDYGAGASHLRVTDEMMYEGRSVTTTVGEICRISSSPPSNALLLFQLIRGFRPKVCLELGTNLGIAAAYQAAALMLNGSGRIITLEGADSIASLAIQHLGGLGLNAEVVVGRFQDTLGGVLREHGPIDFAFVDGHHDEHATLRYFDQIRPALMPRAVLVFDDISWSAGMQRAWQAITEHAAVALAIDLSSVGICLIDPAGPRQQVVRWSVL
jgi:predicted O-methyltransferase YrrM